MHALLHTYMHHHTEYGERVRLRLTHVDGGREGQPHVNIPKFRAYWLHPVFFSCKEISFILTVIVDSEGKILVSLVSHRRQSCGCSGIMTPRFWDGGVVGSPWNNIISYKYNVQECEMRTLYKSGDFSEIEIFVYNQIPGMIPQSYATCLRLLNF